MRHRVLVCPAPPRKGDFRAFVPSFDSVQPVTQQSCLDSQLRGSQGLLFWTGLLLLKCETPV